MNARSNRTWIALVAALLSLTMGTRPAPAEERLEAPPASTADDDASDAAPQALRAGDYFSKRFNDLSAELNERLATPRAAASLYRLYQLGPRLDTLAPLAQLLSRVAEEPKALPDVRALAHFLLADVTVSRGRVAKAREELSRLQLAQEGWIVGGFDNEGGTGHGTAFAPEKGAIDLKATYQGKEREIAWRKLPALGPAAFVPVVDLIRPTKNVTFYYLTTLDSPVAQRALLALGTSGATKLWVNGQLAVDDADDHPARFDQREVAVALRKGSNVVLLKVSSLDEPAAFFLRAAAVTGKALLGAKWSAPAGEQTITVPAIAAGKELPALERPAPVEDLTQQLAKLADKSPSDAGLRADYALLLDQRRPFDTKTQKGRREAEKAAQLAPADPRAQLHLAGTIDDDHNEKRKAIEAALKADPAFAPARTQLGSYYVERGFSRRGYDEIERATRDMPDYYPAQLALADALDALGQDARARRLELSLAAKFPSTPEVVLAAARAEKQLGRLQKAIERYRVVLSLRYDNAPARNELANLLLDTGDVNGAAALLERGIELSPTILSTGLRLADMLSRNRQPARAAAVYDSLAKLVPDDDQVFEGRGKHELQAGDEQAAVADFQKALALRPQNPKLRELLRSVRPQENYAQPYLRDAVQLAKEARAAGKPPRGDDAIELANVDVVRVYPNGLSSRYRQEIAWLQSERGVEQARVQGVRYSPGEQEVKVEQARIIKADGSVVEAKSETDQDLSDSSGGMYFDHRQRTVVFPNLEQGDVVEFTYRQDDVSQTNMFADYFGDVDYFQGTNPKKDVEYVLIAPASRQFYANSPALPGLRHDVTERAAAKAGEEPVKVWRWAAKDVAKLEPEPKMPGWANVAAYLHVSTFKEWNDVARFWWGLVHDQLHVTPEVAQAAEEAVKGIPQGDVRGRVRAVYDYVVTKTRYVGLEFGIHGFKPYTVDRILARRFGDCKDKASLMYAMLDHLGISSRLVLLRMRHLGQLAEKPASLAVFNHAILYVPELDLYLDGTAEFSGSGEVPGSDQGAQVLIVEPDAKNVSRFLTTPVSKAQENVTDTQYDVTVAADGSARIKGQSTIKGQAAQGYRRAYESETGRRERFEQGYARTYPGAKAVSFEISDPRAIEKPVETKFQLDVPQFARKEGDSAFFRPFGEPFRYVEGTAPLSRRTYPLELGAPWRNEFTFHITLPAGLQAADVQTDVEKTGPFGSYRYVVQKTADGVQVTGHVSLASDQIAPAQYGEFRAFLEEIDRAFSRRLRLQVAPSAASVRPAQAPTAEAAR